LRRGHLCGSRTLLESVYVGATIHKDIRSTAATVDEDSQAMTNEEMQQAMEFIVNQQAQASAKIDALSEAQQEAQKAAEEQRIENERRSARLDERWERTEEGIRALLSVAEIHERDISMLGEKIAEVSENGRATDERLNALINTVERQISEGRNGKL
jgi:polyribonucleotide nucleotidyltransferase